MKSRTYIASVVFLSGAFLTMGCAANERVVVHTPASQTVIVKADATSAKGVVVKVRPPALRKEVKPRRPFRGHVWVGGYWSWRSGKYVWVRGKWVAPPRGRAVWVPGHWKKQRGGWVWVGGHWR